MDTIALSGMCGRCAVQAQGSVFRETSSRQRNAMSLSSNRFANAALNQARNYDRRYRKLVPFSEVLDTLRRHAAFDLPLKFVLDRDSESSGLFKRGPL